MDYKNSKAPKNTVTRDINQLTEPVGNVYETVAIIAKRIKRELDAKLQDFSIPQDSLDETFENKEQIEISRQYERLPKPTLMATQEFIDGELVYRSGNKDEALK